MAKRVKGGHKPPQATRPPTRPPCNPVPPPTRKRYGESVEHWTKGDWIDEAKAQRAEVERLQGERDRHAQAVASLSAEVERLREALRQIAWETSGSDLKSYRIANAALADDEKED